MPALKSQKWPLRARPSRTLTASSRFSGDRNHIAPVSAVRGTARPAPERPGAWKATSTRKRAASRQREVAPGAQAEPAAAEVEEMAARTARTLAAAGSGARAAWNSGAAKVPVSAKLDSLPAGLT